MMSWERGLLGGLSFEMCLFHQAHLKRRFINRRRTIMQDATTQSELHPLHSSGDLPPIVSQRNREASNRRNTINQPERSKANLRSQERRLRYHRVAHLLSNAPSF